MELWKDSNFFLLPDSPRKKYEPGTKKFSPAWGQLKLFANELFALTYCWVPNAVVVYAGAAPGYHINVLAKMFPEATFHLYDPRESKVTSTDKIHVYREYFTDDTARTWANRQDIIFFSDIRREGYKGKEETENEQLIWEDMLAQQRWVEIMKPVKSMLKMRLPYATKENLRTGSTRKYLGGLVMFQPFALQSSTETRLFPDGTTVDWDYLIYEEQLYYHNTQVRGFPRYLNPFTGGTEPISTDPDLKLDNDYDTTAFVQIVIYYIRSRGVQPTRDIVLGYIRQIIQHAGGANRFNRRV
jgi:cap2 methyltransferase